MRRRDCVRVTNISRVLRLYDVMVRYNLRKVSLVIVEEGRKLCGQVRKLGCWKVPVKKEDTWIRHENYFELILCTLFHSNITYESNVGEIVGSNVGSSI